MNSEVSWPLNGIDGVEGVEIYATATFPSGVGPFPAVIFVAGSGSTDRNWNSPLIPGTNGSAALLAQALTAQGFVTLRYDKVAAGPHARENMTRLIGKVSMDSHRCELTGGLQWLAAQPQVDANHLFVLTNSEGGVHALNYVTQGPAVAVAGLVLTAPPARPMGALARAQIAAQLGAVPGGDALLAAYDAAMADFAAGREVNVDAQLPEMLRVVIQSVTAPINQPFARELWVFDTVELLPQVSNPVLILIGKKDIQVDWQVDGALLEPLTHTQRNITLVYAEDANHVLKHEPRPRAEFTPAEAVASYSADSTTLDAQALETITRWLKVHAA
jgi:pimeloyl-ACP methyl ester carboxylesterase